MENIIKEFSQWWKTEISNCTRYDVPTRMFLLEERGVNYEQFNSIVSQLYNYLKQFEDLPYLKHPDGYLYFTTNPLQLNDVFIKTAFFTIYPSNEEDYLANGASFVFKELKYDNKLDKCINCHIELYANPLKYINFDGIDVIQFLWHEIQHVYRQYNILKQECIKGKTNVKANAENNLQSDVLNYYGNDYIDFIRMIYYLTDKDEIDARMQEIIPFLLKHTNINRNNYKEYLSEFIPFQFIQYLKGLKTYFQVNILASDDVENIGNFIKSLYKHNEYYAFSKISPSESVKKLYNRFLQSILYAENQFYKILFHMFQKLKRDMNESSYKKICTFKRIQYKPFDNKESKIEFRKLMEDFEKMKGLYKQQFEETIHTINITD